MSLNEIITKAIPFETCPVKEEHAKCRRVWLKEQIEKLIKDNKPYKPEMDYKNE